MTQRTRVMKNGDVLTSLTVNPERLAQFKKICADRNTSVSAEFRRFILRQIRRAK